MPTNMTYFLPGFIGAIAPEVLRLYGLRRSNTVQFQNWYFAISLLYMLLGGYVATIIPLVTNPWLAFAVGVALPNVINFATKVIDQLTGGTPGDGTDAQPTVDEGAGPAGTRGAPAPRPSPAPDRGQARPGTFRDFIRAL